MRDRVVLEQSGRKPIISVERENKRQEVVREESSIRSTMRKMEIYRPVAGFDTSELKAL